MALTIPPFSTAELFYPHVKIITLDDFYALANALGNTKLCLGVLDIYAIAYPLSFIPKSLFPLEVFKNPQDTRQFRVVMCGIQRQCKVYHTFRVDSCKELGKIVRILWSVSRSLRMARLAMEM